MYHIAPNFEWGAGDFCVFDGFQSFTHQKLLHYGVYVQVLGERQ